MPHDRRDFLQTLASAAGLVGVLPATAIGQTLSAAPTGPPLRRPIPSAQPAGGGNRETLPVIGLGTADAFNVSPDNLSGSPLTTVMTMLLKTPGSVLDTAPSYGSAEAVAGELLRAQRAVPGGSQGSGQTGNPSVFLATKISASAGSAAQGQWARSLQDLRVDKVDLLQVHNLIDWRENLRMLRALKDEGKTRYIGVTHYRADAHAELVQIARAEPVNFIQVNYSLAEREAEKTLLPLCRERGIAVLVNRPFQDGRLFRAVQGKPVPEWAGEIDCTSWGQLFLKFIVSHPAVTAAIPATANPRHMQDNLGAGTGRMPDARQRERIAALLA